MAVNRPISVLNADNEMRIIIRVRVTDIPGEPSRRFTTLGELFAESHLSRSIQQRITPDGYDGVVIPPEFNSEKPVIRWFIYDMNVRGTKTREELLHIPHKVFLACKQEDCSWIFVQKDNWTEAVKRYSKTYFWGGRTEQGWLAEMRAATAVT